MNHPIRQDHYKTRELAELLSCSEETILRAAQSGQLFSRMIGRERRYPESGVVAWLEVRASPARVVALRRRSA